MRVLSFETLSEQDLVLDAVYEGGSRGNASDDPIAMLLPGVGNQGGFRAPKNGKSRPFVVLYSSGEDKDWPDQYDQELGRFIYYGDNKIPGHSLLETPRGGNRVLEQAFEMIHTSFKKRMPSPFFVFLKHPTVRSSRAVQFRGLAVPGAPGLDETEDLVAIWKTKNDQRFQNYRAVFTVLDVKKVSREWINDLIQEKSQTNHAPEAWTCWLESGKYKPLVPHSRKGDIG